MSSVVPHKNKRFFELLSEEHQEILLLHGTEILVRSGQVLFYEGEDAKHIFLIREGQVRLSKMTIDNKKFFLHLKQKHDIVGEFSLFNEMSLSMTAEVVTDSRLVRFDQKNLEALFTQHGDIAVSFIKLFAKNTQSTQAKFSDLLLYGKTGAFYSILIRFSNSYGVNHKDGILIDIKLTNQDLAYFIGTTRETVNRMLNDLKKDNIISVRNGYIIIHQIDFLRKHLHCEKCPLEICTIS
ncbi:CRP/FNR family transcriptional regulator, anaerobic regulatory protein [Evansella caseinilytica]|uniref:CRP/FNR family transcriptional regulator, anaerobic regulatory protein n=1 Tax=Evansella caseinilytica TaxID=1503961 RepID=A0A1H3PIM3_9BACI|nr:Crp/Fnr family transcriptional regulator [Evansella caseinilytica]SDZ00954.1 CRP/FNR family transcriptional regulator, anaerobic regulatory protein [Evansella caseinilytica]